ncbi:MAG: carbohydrate kinase family protein [Lentisphaeria bacterium]|nr:carbohydrate kinase family protein [Lentisphaeria bacterium]
MAQRCGIIGAGNWIVDEIRQLDRWPGEGNLANIIKEESPAGGGGAHNVLLDLAAMTNGSIPLFGVGCVGDDKYGKMLLENCAKAGVDTKGIRVTNEAPTSYTTVMAADGKRTFFHNHGANDCLNDSDFSAVDYNAKVFYLGYLLLLAGLDAKDDTYGTKGAKVLREMRAKGLLTVLDLVSTAPETFHAAVLAAMPGTDVLVVNEIEAGNAFNVKIRRDDDTIDFDAMKAVAPKFFEAGLHKMLVIHYPEGAYAREADGAETQVKAYKAPKIVGSTGAGDAFCAGMLYALHEGLPVEESLHLGAANAIFNLADASSTGGAVSIAEVRKFMESQK